MGLILCNNFSIKVNKKTFKSGSWVTSILSLTRYKRINCLNVKTNKAAIKHDDCFKLTLQYRTLLQEDISTENLSQKAEPCLLKYFLSTEEMEEEERNEPDF